MHSLFEYIIVYAMLLAKLTNVLKKNVQLHPESAAEHLLINSDVTKHGRANKPSTSCPEPGRNWMKDEDAYSASLYYIVQNDGPRQLLP